MIASGCIAFSHPKKLGFYSKSVRYFTKSQWSHCFFVGPAYMGELIVIETDLKVQAVPFWKEYIQKDADVFEVYCPAVASMEDMETAARVAFLSGAGETYGFLSIPWFAIRSLYRRIFKGDLKVNFSRSGMICSELLVIYLKALGGEYERAFQHLSDNETSPEDIYEVVTARPDLFQRIL